MSTDVPRRIAKLVATLQMPAGIHPEYRDQLKEIGNNCPVVKSIQSDIQLEITYAYPD